MKLTKREYTKQMNALVARRNTTVNACNEAIDAVQYIGRIVTNEEVDNINGMHDEIRNIDQEIKDLESQWGTRNWTGSDWNTYSLIVQNID